MSRLGPKGTQNTYCRVIDSKLFLFFLHLCIWRNDLIWQNHVYISTGLKQPTCLFYYEGSSKHIVFWEREHGLFRKIYSLHVWKVLLFWIWRYGSTWKSPPKWISCWKMINLATFGMVDTAFCPPFLWVKWLPDPNDQQFWYGLYC